MTVQQTEQDLSNSDYFLGGVKNAWWKIWWISLGLKLVLATVIPLFNDEAYYWAWAQSPQLSYFDHPPFVMLLSWISDNIFSFLSVRWSNLLLGHLSYIVARKILHRLNIEDETQQVQLLLLLLASPLFGVGSILLTPDVPHIFTWLLCTLLALDFVIKPSTKGAALLGASLGLGFLAKYQIVLFALGFLLFLLISKNRKLYLHPLAITAAILTGLTVSSPVLIWNYQHEWSSFRFQLEHGLGQSSLSAADRFSQLFEFIAGQTTLLFPYAFALFYGMRRRNLIPTDPKMLLLACTSFGSLLFFAYSSLKKHVEPNWTIAAQCTVLVLTISTISHLKSAIPSRVVFWSLRPTLFLWTLLSVLLITVCLLPQGTLLSDRFRDLKSSEFFRYEVLEDSIKRDFAEGRQPFASSYQMAADLSYRFRASKKLIPKIAGFRRRDFFDDLAISLPTEKEISIYLETDWGWPMELPIEVSKRNYVVKSVEVIGSYRRISLNSTTSVDMNESGALKSE